jgi:hypothetical protein
MKTEKNPNDLYPHNSIYDINLAIRAKLRSCGNYVGALHMRKVARWLRMPKRTIEQSFYYGRKLKLEEFLKIIHIISLYTDESPQDLLDDFLESCEYWRDMNKEYIERQRKFKELRKTRAFFNKN